METLLYDLLLGVEFCCSFVGINSIADLIVAGFIQASQVEPDFTDVGVEADRSGVGIESVTVLVDLIVQYSDRAPEGGISTVSVDSLLICFVCFVVSLSGHVSPSEEVPALGIVTVWTRQHIYKCLEDYIPVSRLLVK